jgi:hypothetical protein
MLLRNLYPQHLNDHVQAIPHTSLPITVPRPSPLVNYLTSLPTHQLQLQTPFIQIKGRIHPYPNLLPLLLQILLIIPSLKLLLYLMTQRDHNEIDIPPLKFCTLTKYNLYNLKQTNNTYNYYQ